MPTSLKRGNHGDSLPDDVIIVRLAKASLSSQDLPRAHETHFSLSSVDEESDLQSLSVWARDLTPPEVARGLMGENKVLYCLALNLVVKDVRAINFLPEPPSPRLDVVWDVDPRRGAEGHSGIIGLKRPPQATRAQYKAIRARLAQSAVIELLPDA